MAHFKEFVGIDVGARELFVFSSVSGAAGPFANTADGIDAIIALLAPRKGDLVVALEPTGGHEWALWEALTRAGLEVRQVSAAQVRAFAQARGQLAKTDRIDAQIIAGFIAFRPDAGRRLPAQNIRHISALSQKRRQLVEHRKRLSVQAQQERGSEFDALNAEIIALLDNHIRQVEARIDDAIEANPPSARRAEILRSIPGVGPVLAAVLIGQMPELGDASEGQIAALAGVAPMDRQSGAKDARRAIRGGRAEVRTVLYQAALVATTHNPALRSFANRLKTKGKPHKIVMIAVARKLLIIANTLIAKDTLWSNA